MKLIDISGPIFPGMWSYGPPFPDFSLVDLGKPKWVDSFDPTSQAFEGFSMLTGTYIDGPAHAYGLEKGRPMHELPLEKIFGVDAYVYQLDLNGLPKVGRRPCVKMEHIHAAEVEPVPKGAPVLLSTGWGEHWSLDDFLSDAWFLDKEVAEYFAEKRPSILGLDSPFADNLEQEQGNWNDLYGAGINILAPLVNLEEISSCRVTLFVAPLNILNTAGLPVRAVVQES